MLDKKGTMRGGGQGGGKMLFEFYKIKGEEGASWNGRNT